MYHIDPEITQEVLKNSPAIAVVSLSFAGVGLQDWLIGITIIYTLLQLFFLLRDKWWRQRKGKNGRK